MGIILGEFGRKCTFSTDQLNSTVAERSVAMMAMRRASSSTPFRAFLGFLEVLAIVSFAYASQSWLRSSAIDFAQYICKSDASSSSTNATYLAQNKAAMNRMMTSMNAAPTADVDRDFVLMMAPHHQGAIDMAQNVLQFGRNSTIKRIAQEIIVTQQQEIQALHLAVGLPVPKPARP